LSGVFLAHAKRAQVGEEYESYGKIIETTAILAIILTAPLGGVIMNTVGLAMLEKDLPEDKEMVEYSKANIQTEDISPVKNKMPSGEEEGGPTSNRNSEMEFSRSGTGGREQQRLS